MNFVISFNQIIISILLIVSIIFSLIYLEIIELNFCNLNLNLKKNIDNRVKKENNKIFGNLSNINFQFTECIPESK